MKDQLGGVRIIYGTDNRQDESLYFRARGEAMKCDAVTGVCYRLLIRVTKWS